MAGIRLLGLAGGVLLAVMGGLACSHRIMAGATAATMESAVVPPAVETAEPAGMLPPPKRSLVASLRRTACFGSCPVFLAEVWSDGQVIWQGERYVTRIGHYSAQVPAGWITSLLQAGEQAGFFQMSSQYPANGHLVPDLPQTITMLRKGRHAMRIVDNADAPLALIRFERYWQEQLETLAWKPIEQ